MLAQMEEQLHADDPRLAEALGESGGPNLRKVAGICALVGGVAQGWIWLGVLGFIAMAGGLLLALSPSNGKPSGRAAASGGGNGGGGARRGSSPSGGSGPSGGRTTSTKSFMERQQEKWEKRGEGR
jgi:hypothetical protein